MQSAAMTPYNAGSRDLRKPAIRPVLPPVLVEAEQPSDDGIDIRGLVDILRRRWKTVVLPALLLVTAALVYVFLTPALYSASSLLLLDPRDQRILQAEVLPTGAGSDAGLVESQVRIVTATTVLSRVVENLKLSERPEFGGTAPTADERTAAALAKLERRIAAQRADRTYLLELRATAQDPLLAQAIANGVAEAYLAEQTDAARSATRRTNEALTARLNELRESVRVADEKVQAFRAEHGLAGRDGSVVTEQQLLELNQRLIQARAALATAQARYDQIQRSDVAGSSEALASQVITGLRTQEAEISRREADLSATLGDRHPSVIKVRAELSSIRAQIAAEISRISQSAANTLAVARGDVAALQAELDRLTGRDLKDGAALITLRELQREADAVRELYQSVLARAKQTGEQQLLETTSARIVAPAGVPSAATFPPKPLIVGVALAFGLGLGAALALLRERFDDRIRDAAQLRRAGLNVFAVVPPFKNKGAGIGGFDYAIRLLRTELRDSVERSQEQSLLIVSSRHGDGAPTIALNLALAAVAAGENVLIIDADITHRTLSSMVAPNARLGLAEVMSGACELPAALVGDAGKGFQVLPYVQGSFAGRRPARAAYEQLVADAREHFDYVIVVAAPLMDEPDARAIAEAVDQVALVVRSDDTTRGDVAMALRALRVRGEKTCGVVLATTDGV